LTDHLTRRLAATETVAVSFVLRALWSTAALAADVREAIALFF
jgi:hypothetical protein